MTAACACAADCASAAARAMLVDFSMTAGAVVLPITWTVEEGQFALTDVLLRDLLMIRGDRSAYYYGRRLLWEKHPRIMQILVDKAPNLLQTFLDGHMWTCR
jgi:hypothetical protein